MNILQSLWMYEKIEHLLSDKIVQFLCKNTSATYSIPPLFFRMLPSDFYFHFKPWCSGLLPDFYHTLYLPSQVVLNLQLKNLFLFVWAVHSSVLMRASVRKKNVLLCFFYRWRGVLLGWERSFRLTWVNKKVFSTVGAIVEVGWLVSGRKEECR